MKNIGIVVKNNLCTGCGTCAGVCPTNAITMCKSISHGLFLPEVNEEECTDCGFCLRCCPGYALDMQQFNASLFGKEPEDSLVGNYVCSYVGYSNDIHLRSDASSGGIVTQLLIFALEEGIIDGVLVSRMKKSSPLEPEPFIAKTKEEIIAASKSKYCPVPMNVALREIIEQRGKFAVVGLPCHMHGIRLAESVINGLKEKIVMHVGLFCSHTVNFHGTEFLLDKYGINAQDVSLINYRGNGWPGSMSIQLKNGRKLTKQFDGSWNAYWNVFTCFFFTPIRCMMCPDQSNEFSDISVGDAWLSDFKHTNLGQSVMISRSRDIEKLLHLMESSKLISLKRILPNKVHESQNFSLDFKKKKIGGRFFLFKLLGMNVPIVNPMPTFRGLTCFNALLAYLSVYISSNKRLVHLLRYVPLPLFRLYFGLFKISTLRTIERGNCT